MKRIATLAVAGSAACVFALTSSVPAFAAGTPDDGPKTLAQIQAAASTATSARITSLKEAIAKVNANTSLTASDRAEVLTTFNADITAMGTLEAKVQADTTVETAQADYREIFTGYRVYAVAIPQAYEAGAADRLTGTAIPKLQSAHDKLAANLAAHPEKWSTAMKAQLDDMQAKITDASNHANGQAAKALSVTPAQYNADKTVITSIRASLKTATTDAKAAEADGRALLKALK